MRRRDLLGGVASLAAMGLGFSYSPRAEAAPRRRTKRKAPSPAMRNAFRVARAEDWPKVAEKHQRALAGIVQRLVKRRDAKAKQAWTSLVKRMGKVSNADLQAIVDLVMRRAYLEQVDDLKEAANKLRFYNQQKKAVRDARNEAQRRRDTAKKRGKATVHRLRLRKYKPGAKAVRSRQVVSMTYRQLRSYESELQKKTSSLSELGDMMRIDLQDALQKKNQVFAMMSNMTKMMHDTAKSIIGNMKA